MEKTVGLRPKPNRIQNNMSKQCTTSEPGTFPIRRGRSGNREVSGTTSLSLSRAAVWPFSDQTIGPWLQC
ncbi:hypothetical protein MHYP_G00178750 [Metynnis hypsauchen]